MKKVIQLLTYTKLIFFLIYSVTGQDVRVVPENNIENTSKGDLRENKKSDDKKSDDEKSDDEKSDDEKSDDEEEIPDRNPFATAAGPTNQRLRLARDALSGTQVVGIIHIGDKKFAAIQMDLTRPALILPQDSIFNIRASGGQWIDVTIKSIGEYDVQIAPSGTSDVIIIR